MEISLTVANTDDLLDRLHAGRLDLAFVGLGGAPPPGVDVHVVADEPLVAVVSPADPLAGRTTITLAALAEHTLISLPRGSGLRSALDDACAGAGLRPRIVFEAGDPRVLAQLAARGLGVAVVPRSVADARRAQLHTVAITHPVLRGRIALAWRAAGPVGPAARAMRTRIRAQAPARR